MGIRQWLPLIGVVVSVFIFNMSEFMPIGLLTDISGDFGISESAAGLIVSFYAWAVAILSLPLMLLLKKMQYRPMFLLCVFLFAFFQFLSGMSQNYLTLMVSRIGVAVSHAVFWSVAAHLAVSVVEKKYRRFALSAVATGTSLAMILGLPLGRVIGLALGWRMAFVTIGVIAVADLILLAAVFPKVNNPGTFTVKRLPDIARNKTLVGLYIFVAVLVTGYFTAYSYIDPFLETEAGFSETMITLALTVFGIAGILGSILFTKYYDVRKYAFVISGQVGLAVALLLLGLTPSVTVAVFAACALWGMTATMFNLISQNEVMNEAPSDGVPVAMSLQSGIYNVGIASGSIVGGVVTDSMGVGQVGNIGAALVFLAAVFVTFCILPGIRRKDLSRQCE